MSDVIMYDSDEAAKPVTLSGWQSKDGHFWVNKDDPKFAEHHARWGGCTHLKCECGNTHQKHWTCCTECRNKKSSERFNALDYQEWNGEPVCLWDGDEYFFSECDIEQYADDNEIEDVSKIQLIICEPQYARQLEADDIFQDLLPEDQYVHDVAPKLAEAIENVNKIIREEKEIMCWMPGKIRTSYKLKK